MELDFPLKHRFYENSFFCLRNANQRLLLEVKSASLIKKLAANKQYKTYERLKEKQPEGAAEESFHLTSTGFNYQT